MGGGGGALTWTEIAKVILDMETQINRRPLTYVEDDVELPLLTLKTFLYQRTIVKSDSKSRGVWSLGIVVSLHPSKDDITRAIGVRTPNSHIERESQHLYPLELHCDSQPPALNPQAEEFTPRPKRDAAVTASRRIQDIAEIKTQAV